MSLCPVHGGQCVCQPDAGVPCPDGWRDAAEEVRTRNCSLCEGQYLHDDCDDFGSVIAPLVTLTQQEQKMMASALRRSATVVQDIKRSPDSLTDDTA